MKLLAKKTFLFIISLAVFLLPYFVRAQMGYSNTTETIRNTGVRAGLPINDFDSLIIGFLSWLLAIFTILAVISFIVSGIMFLMAGSNKDLADKARAGVQYSIIGIAVALSAYIIIILIQTILNGTADTGTTPGTTTPPTYEI